MRQVYTHTVAYAMQRNKTEGQQRSISGGVTPWLALGTGDHLRPTHNCSGDASRYNEPCSSFAFGVPYDPVLSWQLGTELNNLTQYSNTENPAFPPADSFAPW